MKLCPLICWQANFRTRQNLHQLALTSSKLAFMKHRVFACEGNVLRGIYGCLEVLPPGSCADVDKKSNLSTNYRCSISGTLSGNHVIT
ncbi:hypothetical protein NC652_017810 [Populus alba x Populus x berolinensis]|nr:hypothetical protein NC652_017810 [Populus alba x Populus x berolinensis]